MATGTVEIRNLIRQDIPDHSVTVAAGAVTWENFDIPDKTVAIIGYYLDSTFLSIRSININSVSKKASLCVKNWSSSSVTSNVNIQVLVEQD